MKFLPYMLSTIYNETFLVHSYDDERQRYTNLMQKGYKMLQI